ncbi:hypothetical protein [Pseudomonas sp. ICMP 561]|uniref:hypothetical protein n=1 Tax=Pseudomonas sp. ICMP 561 TaxID=1718918 RepID=UPI000C075711|nr:hypothetical protein [Pseudomonas sp. ICMP 561]PHN17215.1 hypothetical protein AO242_21220 [Pseudomonas sp. ICMP 561]
MQAKTLKSLIADHGVSFDAATIMNTLVKTGHAEVFQYPSTTGSGVMKSFKRLTDKAEHIGINKASMGHPFKTEPKFYAETFADLLNVVVRQLHEETVALVAARAELKAV